MEKIKRPQDVIPWPLSAAVIAAVYRQTPQTTAKWLGWKRKTATGSSKRPWPLCAKNLLNWCCCLDGNTFDLEVGLPLAIP
jgi:hypothetical protein